MVQKKKEVRRSISFKTILGLARRDSIYGKKTSELNKKWVRYLKNRKLFDEYMVYLANHDAVSVEPFTYLQLSNICYNMSKFDLEVGTKNRIKLNVDWIEEFHKFARKNIKWYDIKHIFLYAIHGGYI